MNLQVPTSPIASRASFFLSRASAQLVNGTTKSVQTLLDGIRQMIDSIGWATLRVRPLLTKELPYGDDYTAMVNEITYDTSTLFASMPQVAQQGLNTANFGEAQRVGLLEQVKAINSSVDLLLAQANLQLRGHTIGIGEISSVALQQAQIFLDTFATSHYLNMSSSQDIYYEPTSGIVTLQRNTDINYSPTAIPFIDFFDGTNYIYGFPGNTVEVEAPAINMVNANGGNGTEPTVTFIGQSTLNADPGALIDGDPNTVYEFERLALAPQNQSVIQVGDAWLQSDTGTTANVYSLIQPDTWTVSLTATDTAGQSKTLSLPKLGVPSDTQYGLYMDLTLSLPEPRLINHITITPYLPANASMPIPVMVQQITVTPEVGVPLVINTGEDGIGTCIGYNITGQTDYPLPVALIATKVEIIFRQPTTYLTNAGHNFLVATVQEEVKRSVLGITYSDKTSTSKVRLLNQEEALNYNKSSSTGKFTAAAALIGFAAGGPVGAAIGWVLGSLFGKSVTQNVTGVASGVDVFAAKRWQIALSGIDLLQLSYQSSGTLVSQPLAFAQAVAGVRILPNMSVPVGTTLTFEVSGDGQTWVATDPSAQLITTLATPSSQVYVRATLGRQDMVQADKALTPVLKGYRVEGYYA